MAFSRVVFSAVSEKWATPTDLFAELHREFNFTLDPCPIEVPEGFDGLKISWGGQRVYCNPPYGRGIGNWIRKAFEAELTVFLLPVRSDTKWFHKWVLPFAKEIRFLEGRLKYGGAKHNAPFPSMVVVFDWNNNDARSNGIGTG